MFLVHDYTLCFSGSLSYNVNCYNWKAWFSFTSQSKQHWNSNIWKLTLQLSFPYLWDKTFTRIQKWTICMLNIMTLWPDFTRMHHRFSQVGPTYPFIWLRLVMCSLHSVHCQKTGFIFWNHLPSKSCLLHYNLSCPIFYNRKEKQ